jgi:hypothetical protein
MKRIKLTQGKFALVSDVDYVFLNQWKWCTLCYPPHRLSAGRTIYTSTGHTTILMHRLIIKRMGFKNFTQVDHVNRNQLDNRRSNLRPATNAENCRNKIRHRDNMSGFKGVHWNKPNRKWVAQIQVDYRKIYLGLFINKEEAARAYNSAAKKYHGEYARLNVL